MPEILTLVIATGNPGKIAEIRDLLTGFPIDIKTLDEFGPIPPVVEDGDTFEENAYKKASFVSRVLGFPALADDSGLVVEALDGAPGVYSARYAGDNASDQQRYTKLLNEMKGKSDRQAAFECVLSLAIPTGAALTYEARCEGLIAEKPAGESGFGYDPVFLPAGGTETFGEMDPDAKHAISHRSDAFRQLIAACFGA